MAPPAFRQTVPGLSVLGVSMTRMDASAWIAIAGAAVTIIVAAITLPFTARGANSAQRQAEYSGQQTDLQRRLRRDAAQPYVWADLQGDDAQGFLINLVVCNEGPTVATDVRVTFDPPLESTLDNNSFDQAQEKLKGGLSSLAPGRRMQWIIGTGPDILNRDESKYTVSITGNGPFGKLSPLSYVIDLSDLRFTASAPYGSLHRVAERIKDLTKVVEKW
jgi:hypothetical protein